MGKVILHSIFHISQLVSQSLMILWYSRLTFLFLKFSDYNSCHYIKVRYYFGIHTLV